MPTQPSSRSQTCLKRDWSGGDGAGRSATSPSSAKLADVLLEEAPNLDTELFLPLGIESSLAQNFPEQRRIGLVEHHAPRLQVGLHRLVQISDVFALLHAGGVELAGG